MLKFLCFDDLMEYHSLSKQLSIAEILINWHLAFTDLLKDVNSFAQMQIFTSLVVIQTFLSRDSTVINSTHVYC